MAMNTATDHDNTIFETCDSMDTCTCPSPEQAAVLPQPHRWGACCFQGEGPTRFGNSRFHSVVVLRSSTVTAIVYYRGRWCITGRGVPLIAMPVSDIAGEVKAVKKLDNCIPGGG